MYMSDPDNYEHSPERLMDYLGVSVATLHRYFRDLRECGAMNYSYTSKGNEFVFSEKDGTAIDTAKRRRKLYLTKLARMCLLLNNLPLTDMSMLESYENQLSDYLYALEHDEEHDDYPPEKPEVPDLKGEYYKLCPNVSERTRQRDFDTLRDAGFVILYSQRYKGYLFTDEPYYTTSEKSYLYNALVDSGDIKRPKRKK
jgi:predicted DNA-binding transcriptional regulator YafY